MDTFCSDSSVLGRSWALRPAGIPFDTLVTVNGTVVPRLVAEIISRRGAQDIAGFVAPTLRTAMPDPLVLSGMQEAVETVATAVLEGKSIALFGDYDVDGATSIALVYRYLRQIGHSRLVFYVPQRLTEGYGPNIPAVESLREGGAELLVLLDSGTLGFDPIARARELGMRVVVLDHHEPREDGALPDAVLVNPKKPEDLRNVRLDYLCTAGLSFLFLVGLNRHLRERGFFRARGIEEPRLADLLGLVALGTVADVVPLVGLNRAYVALGLRSMDRIMGIRALMEQINANRTEAGRRLLEYSVYACGFALGPCINAAGRISDTMQGSRLLVEEDPLLARNMAATLFALNRDRQAMQEAMVSACMARLSAQASPDAVIVAYDEAWHPGVVGLGASKVKDAFDRPAVIIGQGGKGSARSVPGFNIGQALIRAAELGILLKGGGHAAAAGLTIEPEKVPELQEFLNLAAQGFVRPPTEVDLVVPVGELTLDDVRGFGLLAPFGKDNPHPLVAVTGGVLTNVGLYGAGTLKGRLVSGSAEMEVILFKAEGTPLGNGFRAAAGHQVDVIGEAKVNEYGGRTTIQMVAEDVMVGPRAAAWLSMAA